jgi:hypothetical protein
MVCSVCQALVADVRRTCLCLESTEAGQASSRYRKRKAAEAEKTQKDLDWARIQMGLLEADRDCVREKERKRERERELTELERREVYTKKPFLEILWCDDYLDSLIGVWNNGTT